MHLHLSRPRPPPEVVWAIGFKSLTKAFQRAFTPSLFTIGQLSDQSRCTKWPGVNRPHITHMHAESTIRAVQHLSKPLEVQYENIRQGPQAEFDPPLLQLPAMGAAPSIIWGQLEGIQEADINKISQRDFTFTNLAVLSFSLKHSQFQTLP